MYRCPCSQSEVLQVAWLDSPGVLARSDAVEQHLICRAGGTLHLRVLGLINPRVREVAEMAYEFDAPFVVDDSAFRRAFGGMPTPHEEAIRRTLEWHRVYADWV